MFVQIPGFSSYLVDENGVVVSTFKGKWKVLRLSNQGSGYLKATLFTNTVRRAIGVHRLVLLAWKGDSLLQVNHINGIKTDNRLSNLEYCSSSENNQHAYDAGLKTGCLGETNGMVKLSERDVRKIKKMLTSNQFRHIDIAKQFGVSRATVQLISAGKTWKNTNLN